MPTASTEPHLAARRDSYARNASGGRVAGLLLSLALLAQGTTVAVAVSALSADPEDPDQVARGERIYAKACASCHGTKLEGEADWRSQKSDGTYPAPPHDAEGHTWHHSDRLLFRYTKLGGAAALGDVPGFRSAMPGFAETLSDAEIRDVLAYIKSHWPEEMREYQRAVTENDT